MVRAKLQPLGVSVISEDSPEISEGALASGVPVSRWARRRLLLCDLLWVPSALWILIMILTYSVDIPSIDQWDGELPFLMKSFEGVATFDDFIAPHLEHRVALNRVAGMIVAKFFGWRSTVEAVLMWMLACGCAVNLCVLSRRMDAVGTGRRAAQIALLGLLFFGLPQYAVWLNAMAIQWFNIEIIVIGGLVIAGSRLALSTRFALCMVLATLGTFSSSNGLLTWVLFPPALLLPGSWQNVRRHLPWLAGWMLLASVTVARYFWGFERPPEAPSIWTALGNPGLFVGFFLANVGSPFAMGTALNPVTQAMIAGTIVVLLYTMVAVHTFRSRQDTMFLRQALPWLLLGAYALITGLAMTLGRAGLGPGEAIASRYVNTHVLTAIALVFLVPGTLDRMLRRASEEDALGEGPHSRRLTPAIAHRLSASLVTAAVILHVCYSAAVWPFYENHRLTLHGAKAAVLFIKMFVEDGLLKPLWAGKTADQVMARVDFLDARGFLRPGLVRSPLIRDLAASAETNLGGTARYGTVEQSGGLGGNLVGLSGWAFFPERERAADSVLLTWELQPGEGRAFALADMGLIRDDLVQRFQDSAYRRAGWVKRFDASALPKGKLTIRAWAFDTETAKAYPLEGSFSLHHQ